MTINEILAQLKSAGSGQYRHVMANHGAPVTQFGVKIEFLKTIQKKIKKDYKLSLELYDTGIPEAQYLAGLIADEKKMSKTDLQHWVKNASWEMISEYTVAWIAAESKYGWELALKWIDDKNENIQSSGWNTLASLVGIRPDEELEIKELKKLLKRVEEDISKAGNRVRYSMNSFLIAAGGYVKELSGDALTIGKSIGKITVDMGGTACKVPYSPDYIQKMLDRGVKKRKMARC